MSANCGHCNGTGAFYTLAERRDMMRSIGHTCLWTSEEELAIRNGRTQYGCVMCDLERKAPKP